MAIMELLLRQSYAGQLVLNRWHYIATGTPAAVSLSFALQYAFGFIEAGVPPVFLTGTPFEKMRDLQSSALTYLEAEAKNLYSVTDFYTRPFVGGVTGNAGTDGASPFVAWGFKTNRVRSDIGRGTKRLAGITESAIGGSGVLVAGALTLGNEMAAKFSEVLEYDDEGNTITFTPVVLSYDMYTTPPDPKAYRPYPTEAEQLEHAAAGVLWSVYPQTRSQVSRQVGRGA